MAKTYGGGINVNHSFPTISGNTINENESKNLGGGIYSEYSSPAITGNTISKNKAKSGGGIFAYSFKNKKESQHLTQLLSSANILTWLDLYDCLFKMLLIILPPGATGGKRYSTFFSRPIQIYFN